MRPSVDAALNYSNRKLEKKLVFNPHFQKNNKHEENHLQTLYITYSHNSSVNMNVNSKLQILFLLFTC